MILVVATATTSAAADLVDPATGTRFESEPTVDGTPYRCLGAGVRKLAGNTYSVAYCLENEQADALDELIKLIYPSATGKSLERMLIRDQRFFDALGSIPGDKLVMLHLVRDANRQTLSEGFRASLSGMLPKEKVNKLVSAMPSNGNRGQTILLYSRGSRVVIDLNGASKSLDDEEISSLLWNVWLGPRSLTPTLKSSIAHTASSESNPATASLVR